MAEKMSMSMSIRSCPCPCPRPCPCLCPWDRDTDMDMGMIHFKYLLLSTLFSFVIIYQLSLCLIRCLLLSTFCPFFHHYLPVDLLSHSVFITFRLLSFHHSYHSTFCPFIVFYYSMFFPSTFCNVWRFVRQRFLPSAFFMSTFCRWIGFPIR